MTEDETLARAHRAQSELSITKDLFETMRAELLKKWAATSSNDVGTREKMFEAYGTINLVERALQAAVTAGRVVVHNAETAELLSPRR